MHLVCPGGPNHNAVGSQGEGEAQKIPRAAGPACQGPIALEEPLAVKEECCPASGCARCPHKQFDGAIGIHIGCCQGVTKAESIEGDALQRRSKGEIGVQNVHLV